MKLKTARYPLILALSAAVLLAALVALPGCGQKEEASATRYHCPMHPTYTSDRPGDCPICNMRLVPIESDPLPAGHDHDAQPTGHTAAGETAPSSAGMPMRVPVTLTPEMEQRIGVRLAHVERGPAQQQIRAVGTVEYNESGLHHVHTKVEGWIGKAYVANTGQQVRQGEPLFSLYSPELLATQEELIRALAMGGDSGATLAQAARRRLELWDIRPSDIDAIATSGQARTTIDIVSHSSGIVVEKKALDGMRVMPGEEMYLIADLSRVWINAAVYEYELPLVRVGQEAKVALSYYPGETFRGRIDYIYPYLDERTRTAQVRFVFDNREMKLKPGMFANVELEVPLGDALQVPANAVLDSGEEQIVLVAAGGGRYEPRSVRLGQRLGENVIVLAGVEAGEEVVVGAHFLIDSESQLKAALAGMGAGSEEHSGAHQHGGP